MKIKHSSAPWAKIFFNVLLFIGAVSMLFPFLWMLLSSFKSTSELLKIPPTWWPQNGINLINYKEVFKLIRFDRYMFNSLWISVVNTVVGMFTSALTGYIFAKFSFRFKGLVFGVFMASMMIPFQVIMIPMYSLMIDFGWNNTYWALTVPYFYSVFGIFLMRQFMLKLPNDLMESGLIDGSSHFGIFVKIILPLVKPALASLGIFLFMMNFNDYLWPLIVVDSSNLRTVSLGLASFIQQRGARFDLLMAASVMASFPIIVVFSFAQKQFIEGIALTGMKS